MMKLISRTFILGFLVGALTACATAPVLVRPCPELLPPRIICVELAMRDNGLPRYVCTDMLRQREFIVVPGGTV